MSVDQRPNELPEFKPVPRINKAMATLTMALAVVVGTYTVYQVKAASNQLYVTPSTGNVNQNANISVAIRENSGSDPVNAVQAYVSYNTAQLQYVSTDASNSAFGLQASNSASGGVVRIARATNGGEPAVTGDQLIAVVTFKALVGGGTASSLGFASGSAVVRSTDNANILSSSGGATFSLVTVSTPAPTPTPTSGGGSGHTPTPTPKATSSPGSGSGKTPTPTPAAGATPTATPISSGSSNPTPTPDSSATSGDDNHGGQGSDSTHLQIHFGGTSVTVTGDDHPRVEGAVALGAEDGSKTSAIKVDGGSAGSDDKLDTTYLTNGTHTVTVTLTAADGTKTTVTRTLVVANRLTPWESVRNQLFAPYHGNKTLVNLSVGAIVAVLLLLVGGYLGYRRLWHHGTDGVNSNIS